MVLVEVKYTRIPARIFKIPTIVDCLHSPRHVYIKAVCIYLVSGKPDGLTAHCAGITNQLHLWCMLEIQTDNQ